MNTDFQVIRFNGVELLVYEPWWREGILHGMSTRELSFAGDRLGESGRTLCAAIGGDHLILPRQCHGDDVLVLRTAEDVRAIGLGEEVVVEPMEADALVTSLRLLGERRLVFGVRSADCVPIVVRGAREVALIHAGWRGLANGIIERAVLMLDAPREAVVFAAAGVERYEVDRGVIDAIGASAVYRSSSEEGKWMLDTASTAVKQLEAVMRGGTISSAGVCTIEDERFHSHRRDNRLAGRCVTCFCPVG